MRRASAAMASINFGSSALLVETFRMFVTIRRRMLSGVRRSAGYIPRHADPAVSARSLAQGGKKSQGIAAPARKLTGWGRS